MNVNEKMLQETIDPHLTREKLGQLLSAAFHTKSTVEEIEFLSGGCWNRVVALKCSDREVVLKVKPGPPDKGLYREYEVLEYFTQNTSMPVPRPYFFDDTEKFLPGTLIIMEHVRGLPLGRALVYLSAKQQQRIIVQLGETVAQLHTHKDHGFGGVELAPQQRNTSWAEEWLPVLDEVITLAEKSRQVDADLIAEIREVRPQFPRLLEIGPTGTLVHYDIWGGNVLVDVETPDPRISAFIDVQGKWTDYARELSFMDVFGLGSTLFYQVYTQTHKLDAGCEVRKRLYNIRTHLKHITMYPDESYYRQGARRCLDIVKAALKKL